MRKWVVLFAAISMTATARGQERPLQTESPMLVGIGMVRADFGVEFLHIQRYSLSGLEGDLMRLGVSTVRVGVGEYAEFQVSGVFQDFLAVARRTPAPIPPSIASDTTSDFGDLVFGTKLKLMAEDRTRPALSFKFAVKLPNASNESGLGTDETDFFATLLLAKTLGRAQIVGNLGLAILESAVQPNSQSDMLTYGFGFVVPVARDLELVGEVNGREGPQDVGNESLSQARLGARFRTAGLLWDVSGIAGLRHFSPSYGLTVGITYEFQAFHKKKTPVTIR